MQALFDICQQRIKSCEAILRNDAVVKDKNYDQQALSPVQQMQADVLFVSGTADELWPSTEMSDRMMHILQQHHYSYRYQHLKINGAGQRGLARQYQAEIIEFSIKSTN